MCGGGSRWWGQPPLEKLNVGAGRQLHQLPSQGIVNLAPLSAIARVGEEVAPRDKFWRGQRRKKKFRPVGVRAGATGQEPAAYRLMHYEVRKRGRNVDERILARMGRWIAPTIFILISCDIPRHEWIQRHPQISFLSGLDSSTI